MTEAIRARARLQDWWDHLWFQSVPPDVFALLRMVFGLLGLAAILELTPVSMYWAVDGIAPVPGGGMGLRQLLLQRGLSDAVSWVYFLGLSAAFACMTVGFRTRAAVFASWLGTSLLSPWNHLPLTSAIHVLTSVLFCLLWARCDAAPSVDAWLARHRHRGEDDIGGPQPIWPLRLIRMQVCVIYLNSGLWKLMYDTWRDGTAVHYAINLNIFHRFPYPPTFLEPLTTVATYTTLVWEIGFAFMMMNRVTRRIALWLGVSMHLGMAFMLELGPFSFVMIASYLAFLDPVKVASFSRRRFGTPPEAVAARAVQRSDV